MLLVHARHQVRRDDPEHLVDGIKRGTRPERVLARHRRRRGFLPHLLPVHAPRRIVDLTADTRAEPLAHVTPRYASEIRRDGYVATNELLLDTVADAR